MAQLAGIHIETASQSHSETLGCQVAGTDAALLVAANLQPAILCAVAQHQGPPGSTWACGFYEKIWMGMDCSEMNS